MDTVTVWSERGRPWPPLFLCCLILVMGCRSPGDDTNVEITPQVVDSLNLICDFEFLPRNAGSFMDGDAWYFFCADIESYKRLSVFDDSLRLVREFDLSWLVDEYGELSGIGLADTGTYWALTKYTNQLIHCVSGTLAQVFELVPVDATMPWSGELDRSWFSIPRDGLAVDPKRGFVLRVDWEEPGSCPPGSMDCCYFDSIRYRPMAMLGRFKADGGLERSYIGDSLFFKLVPGQEIHYLVDALGFATNEGSYVAYSSWSHALLVGMLEDPGQERIINVMSSNGKCNAEPIPCQDIGDGSVLNERLGTQGSIAHVIWDVTSPRCDVLVTHDRESRSGRRDFSIIKYDTAWGRIGEVAFVDSDYDPVHCYAHPRGLLLAHRSRKGADRSKIRFDILAL